jgi:hypothetical protein
MAIDKKIQDAVKELRKCKKCAEEITIGNLIDYPEVFISFPMRDLDICEKTSSGEYSLQFTLSVEDAESIKREIGKSITKAKKNIKK